MNELLLYGQRRDSISDNMIYKNDAVSQECFIRDTICAYFLHVPAFSISSHISKSIVLPVYGFVMRNGIKIIARDNFYGWIVSIELPKPLPMGYLYKDLFSYGIDNKQIKYAEGFKQEWIYDCYDENSTDCTKFTVAVDDKYKFYMLMYLLNKAFENIKFEIDDRDIAEITEVIKEIYTHNGFYNIEENNDLGFKRMKRTMSGFDILRFTHYALSDIRRKENKYDDMEIADNPDLYAEYIYKNPEIKKAFLMEEYMFKTKF